MIETVAMRNSQWEAAFGRLQDYVATHTSLYDCVERLRARTLGRRTAHQILEGTLG
jgi:hypothetical protein